MQNKHLLELRLAARPFKHMSFMREMEAVFNAGRVTDKLFSFRDWLDFDFDPEEWDESTIRIAGVRFLRVEAG